MQTPGENHTHHDGANLGRRRFIKNALLTAGLLTTGGALGIVDRLIGANHRTQSLNDEVPQVGEEIIRAESEKSREEVMDVFKNPEGKTLPKGCFVPEDERTGQDILIGTHRPLAASAESFFTGVWPSLLENLPAGVRVKMLVPSRSEDECLKIAQSKYPHLEFTTLGLTLPSQRSMYMQDIILSTGSKDEQGRFRIMSNVLDRKLMLVKGIDNSLDGLMYLLEDELLARKYPKDFVSYESLVSCVGGDLRTVRLPSGEVAIVVGKTNLTFTLMELRENLESMADNIPLGEFAALLEQALKLYPTSFGIDQVLLLDQDHLLRQTVQAGQFDLSAIKFAAKSSRFFHNDMIVRPVTDPDGKHVAFCSNIQVGPSAKRRAYTIIKDDIEYLERVQWQFHNLGYDIEELPVGPHATTNYTNCVFFTPPGGKKTVLVPQYGIPEDEIALGIYKDRGFAATGVDMKYLLDISMEERVMGGSLNCSTVVLS